MTKKTYDRQQVEEKNRREEDGSIKTDYDTVALMDAPPSKTKKICISLMAVLIGAAFIVAAVIIGTELASNNNSNNNNNNSNPIVQQYGDTAQKIIQYMTQGAGRGRGFEWIANVTDTFGPRKAGTKPLEDAIDYLIEQMISQNFSNVHKENATIPLWIRGQETAKLLKPRQKELSILGLGSTMFTPPEGITAYAVVVRSFTELEQLAKMKNLTGSIVIYNNPWVDYGTSVNYRTDGANVASKYGAVAALIRSVASYSIYSPHTGEQNTANVSQYSVIPAASITVEDAEMLDRMQQRGQTIQIYLNLNSTLSSETIIHNTIFELIGSELPDEIVMVSGHLDSWDVGQGAMDNAAGASLAWQTISALMALNLRPKRTIRGIFWTAEEEGHVGSQEYYNSHRNDVTNETYVFLMESDEGLFAPMDLSFAGSEDSMSIFQQLMPLVSSLNVTAVFDPESLGDTVYWNACDGVPGVFLNSVDEGYQQYFAYHHSNGDMPNVYTPEQVDNGGAIFAVIAYIMADMDTVMTPVNVTKKPDYC